MMRQPAYSFLSLKYLTFLLASTLAGTASVYAQDTSNTSAQAQYQIDIERCHSGQTSQDIKTCLREAGAALQAARKHQLTSGSTSFEANQQARCEQLSGTDRDDCLLLMSDSNTTTQGSVSSGGILRETTITIPAPSGSGTQ